MKVLNYFLQEFTTQSIGGAQCSRLSRDLFLPAQDVFGWPDRINAPATIGDWNWTWRLPWPVDRLSEAPAAIERAAFCQALARATGRA